MNQGLFFLGAIAILAGLGLGFSGAAPAIVAAVLVLFGLGLSVAAFRKSSPPGKP